jgi:hypothetical protein
VPANVLLNWPLLNGESRRFPLIGEPIGLLPLFGEPAGLLDLLGDCPRATRILNEVCFPIDCCTVVVKFSTLIVRYLIRSPKESLLSFDLERFFSTTTPDRTH